jgi:glycosyltransferase involved in cell wall biosynthesis
MDKGERRMKVEEASKAVAAAPKVSIVMPSYNRARFIGEAIESVLAQRYEDWELLIIDDGSTDNTATVVESYLKRDRRIAYIVQEQNRGIAYTRNNGVAQSRGCYIAMLDSDDAWASPEKLGLQVAALDADPGLGIIGTWQVVVDEKGVATGDRVTFPQSDADIRAMEIHQNVLSQSSVVFRKEAFEKAGGYDACFSVNDDHDLWLKIGRSYRFAILPRYDLRYRRHPGNITSTRRVAAAKEELEILKRHRRFYPGANFGQLKGLARLALAFVRT